MGKKNKGNQPGEQSQPSGEATGGQSSSQTGRGGQSSSQTNRGGLPPFRGRGFGRRPDSDREQSGGLPQGETRREHQGELGAEGGFEGKEQARRGDYYRRGQGHDQERGGYQGGRGRDQERGDQGGRGRDQESGGYQGGRGRDQERGGYQGGRGRDQERGGYQGGRGRDQERGGYQGGRGRDQERGGYQGGRGRDQERGGYQGGRGRDQERGGYQGGRGHDQERGGYQGGRGRDQERGGYQGGRGHDQERGGYQGGRGRDQERGGYQGGRGRDHERGDFHDRPRKYEESEQRGRGGYGGRGRGGDRQERGRGRDFHGQERDSVERSETESRHEKPELSWENVTQSFKTLASTDKQADIQPSTSKQLSPEKTIPAGTVKPSGSKSVQLRTSSGFIIPVRKNLDSNVVGTRGTKIMVEVNHLALEIRKSNAIAIHYDVDFKPTFPKFLLRQIMTEFKRKHLKNKPCAFDGKKNLYSCGKLPFGDEFCDTVTIFDDERQIDRNCEVKIKFASNVDMSSLLKFTSRSGVQKLPQDAIQALDIVLRNPASINFTPVGRSFFSPPTNSFVDLGDGLELWRGFYQSVILGWKPYLNIDVAHKGFPKDMAVIEFIMEMRQTKDPRDLNDPLNPRELEYLKKFIKGLKVEYIVPGLPNSKRIYKVNGLKGTPIKERFQLDDKRQMSVGEYFEKEKQYRLKYPNMPCLHVGSEAKTIYVPAELCRVVKGQAINKKLNESQTSLMVRNAARPTDERKKRIMEAIRAVNFNSDPCVQDFGVSVSQSFSKIPARILKPPTLEYADRKQTPREGKWRASKFLSTKPLKSWYILNLAGDRITHALRKFSDSMQEFGGGMGMEIDQPHDILSLPMKYERNALRTLIEYLKNLVKQKADIQLVVVVIQDKDYAVTKQAAELNVGVLTQCIKERTMSKMNPSTCSNILLKINAKLNGVNNSVKSPDRPKLFDRPVMIVGADVTHPPPGEEDRPSFAAVTSSYDRTLFKCQMSWRIQSSRQELIVDLKDIMYEHLMFFYKQNFNLKPEKIIYYRDGVSEGQFSQVLDVEFVAIREACRKFPDYEPEITILIVQKRHHTRFFPTSSQHAEGRGLNVPAGTIVDTDITHPKELDFYLVSHASLQGTARPTKYHKIWDDSDFNDDDLEELTFYLCHLFARCTRSVSYPAPTYYAHLGAFRAKAYMEGAHRIDMENLPREQALRTITQNIKDGNPMFFV